MVKLEMRHSLARVLFGALIAIAAVLTCAFPPTAHADETKTVPLLMIVVGFDGGSSGDSVPYDDSYDWGQAVFGRDDSLASFYSDMSGGTFTFAPAPETCVHGVDGNTNESDGKNDGVVHVTLPRPHGDWGLVNEDREIAARFAELAIEAYQAASDYVDYARFDENADGLIMPTELAVCICLAGYDASAYDDPDRRDIPVLWPHAGKLTTDGDPASAADGVNLDSYIAIAEYLSFDEGAPTTVMQEPIGIIYHELGHYLDLPDLYDTESGSEERAWGAWRVGELSLMDSGGWSQVPDESAPGGMSYKPSAFDAWSRSLLGWNVPRVATKSGTYRVTSELSWDGYSSLLIPTRDPDEFFLVENRQIEGHDEGLAAAYEDGNARGGLVIWHVDKGVYRKYGIENEANNTDHAPALMEQFYEEADGRYSFDWAHSTPLKDEPFFDAVSFEANMNDANAAIELPLYVDGLHAKPSERVGSGVTLQFPSESSPEMDVRVDFESDVAGSLAHACPLDDLVRRKLRAGASGENAQEGACALGDLACAAMRDETGAIVAAVDVGSLKSGLPAGDVTFADVYAALPADANIATYDLTGAQLAKLAEESVAAAAPYRSAVRGLEALESFECFDASSAIRKLDLYHHPRMEEFASRADASLVFGNMTFDVDWDAADGARTSNVQVDGMAIDLGQKYYVALAPGVVECYNLFNDLNQNTLMLWGTPADALRSYIQNESSARSE